MHLSFYSNLLPRCDPLRILIHNSLKLRVGRSHPLADPNGYAYEHLVVWVSAGNKIPEKGWLLHHENDDRTDNRIENLKLMSRADHNALHNLERGRDELGRFKKRGAT